MRTISIRNGEHYYRATVSLTWARRHDNGALVSCGLTVGESGFTIGMLNTLIKRGQAAEITREQWNHSGCQSSCILRGNSECRW